MPDDLEDEIRRNAQGPAKASGDAGSVEQHPLPNQIAADRYLAAKEAAKDKKRGLRFNKFVPPGVH
jgi:endonuclease YncB( thermonuclease family)